MAARRLDASIKRLALLVMLGVASVGFTESQAAPNAPTATAPRAAGPSQRNILLLIADDLGIEASTLYPSPPNIVTTPPPAPVPHLKSLASKGVLLSNAWAAPTCSPTRAMLFTGRYPFRTGVGTPILDPVRDPQRKIPQLSPREWSLPEAFKASAVGRSYELSLIGKWHLSWGAASPIQQGWDYFVGPDPTLL